MKKWNLPQDLESARKVQVFSGGACNIRDTQGALLRNKERDAINDWLTSKGLLFYDPQIHPDTHGTEYDYEIHQPMEIAARSAAQVNIFEISPRTFGGGTSMEVAIDEFRRGQPTIIFFSDGNDDKDVIPKHSPAGYPLFVPYGIDVTPEARRAHYDEMIKNANRMRQYLIRFAEQLTALTITFNETSYEGDIVITPERIHAVELFTAVVRAASGKRSNVNFTGGANARDAKGYPRFIAPENPREVEMRAYLDRYVDEGHELRQAICELVHINVFVRVVYTQSAVIHVLESLLRYKNLL